MFINLHSNKEKSFLLRDVNTTFSILIGAMLFLSLSLFLKTYEAIHMHLYHTTFSCPR